MGGKGGPSVGAVVAAGRVGGILDLALNVALYLDDGRQARAESEGN